MKLGSLGTKRGAGRWIGGAAALALLVGGPALAIPAGASAGSPASQGSGTQALGSPAPSGSIVFMSNRDGDAEIFIMDADGSNQKQLTFNSEVDSAPTLSPDRTRIAFMSRRNSDQDIYTMDVDGSNVTQLTNTTADDDNPMWSPVVNDPKIVYESTASFKHDIWVMDGDGQNQANVTSISGGSARQPTWSPDGLTIAYTSSPYTNLAGPDQEIHTIKPNGSGDVALTNNSVWDGGPDYAPNGRIAFGSFRDGNPEIYEMDADGSNVARITNTPEAESDPSWSLDGSHLTFMSDRDGTWGVFSMDKTGGAATNLTPLAGIDAFPDWGVAPVVQGLTEAIVYSQDRDIFIMRADGSDQTRLTFNNAIDSEPAISPDGQQIAFASNRDGNDEIYVMGIDGSNPVRLTNDPMLENTSPAWSPTLYGSKIAYGSYDHASETTDVWMMESTGQNKTPVTQLGTARYGGAPAWSPSPSGLIAYENNDHEVHSINADGTGDVALTSAAGYDGGPDYAPDGRLAFVTSRHGGFQVYIRDTNGVAKQLVTAEASWSPSWSPNGSHLAIVGDGVDARPKIFSMDNTGGARTVLSSHGAATDPDWGMAAPWSPQQAACASTLSNPFNDVLAGQYFADPVLWLVHHGITSGTGPGAYSPHQVVTRGQMAVFLWKLSGSPYQPGTHGFSDVPAGIYYEHAVIWLVGQNITSGTGGGKFSPNQGVSRAEMAAFLWKLSGSPNPVGTHGFKDVPAGAYYEKAATWLVKQNITAGTGNGYFSPNLKVTRAQMAVFLHRLTCG